MIITLRILNNSNRQRLLGKQINTPLLRCHPDRLTMTSRNNTWCSSMPRGPAGDQPRVMVGLSGSSAFWRCVYIYIYIYMCISLSLYIYIYIRIGMYVYMYIYIYVFVSGPCASHLGALARALSVDLVASSEEPM